MKKVVLSCMLLFLVTGSLYATSNSLVCSGDELSRFSNDRYFETGIYSSDGRYTKILLDTQTVKVDKKKKIIEVWTIWLASEYGREKLMEVSGGTDHYGHTKRLNVYDYELMRANLKSAVFSNCDGSTIVSVPDSGEWQYIVPNSLDETIIQDLIKKYNLK